MRWRIRRHHAPDRQHNKGIRAKQRKPAKSEQDPKQDDEKMDAYAVVTECLNWGTVPTWGRAKADAGTRQHSRVLSCSVPGWSSSPQNMWLQPPPWMAE